jgi:DNA-binding GntR family transcriptional regulator
MMSAVTEPSALERGNISDAAADALREMILDGRLAPGERVNEVRLAAALGVSRTPLREGLRLLAAEGAVDAAPKRGFYVRALTVEELQHLYAVRPLLDPEALRLAGIPTNAQLTKLEKLNRTLGAAKGVRAVELDDEWHLRLIDGCPNRVLVELIQSMMRRTRRYEIALLREGGNVRRATEEHARVLETLRSGDLDAACAALKRNMESAEPILNAWLERRTENQGEM